MKVLLTSKKATASAMAMLLLTLGLVVSWASGTITTTLVDSYMTNIVIVIALLSGSQGVVDAIATSLRGKRGAPPRPK